MVLRRCGLATRCRCWCSFFQPCCRWYSLVIPPPFSWRGWSEEISCLFARRSLVGALCTCTCGMPQLATHSVRYTSCRFSHEASVPLLRGIVPWPPDRIPLFNRNHPVWVSSNRADVWPTHEGREVAGHSSRRQCRSCVRFAWPSPHQRRHILVPSPPSRANYGSTR